MLFERSLLPYAGLKNWATPVIGLGLRKKAIIAQSVPIKLGHSAFAHMFTLRWASWANLLLTRLEDLRGIR